MQIHELSSPRRTDEGLGDLARAAGTALGQAVSPTQNTPTKSAGILDPAQKLAAVKKEPAMVKLATQYAGEWMKQQPATQSVQPAQAQAPAQPAPGETPEQKRIRLQKAAQQNIDKTAVPAPVKTAPLTPTDTRQSKQAQAAQTAQSQMAPFNKLPADQVATQSANIRKAKQAQAAQAAQTQMSAVKEAAGTVDKKTGFANLDGKSMLSLKDLSPAQQQQIQAKQQAAAPVVAKAATVPKFAGPAGYKNTTTSVNGAPAITRSTLPGTTATPAAPGASAFGNMASQLGSRTPNTMANAPVSKTNTAAPDNTNAAPAQAATPPASPASADYLKKFLAFANEKIAMRDPSTYQMIGLTAVEKSKMKPLLDAAKQQVIAAQAKGDPAATQAAVRDYILTAMAGAQLAASENAIKKPQAPAYGTNEPSADQTETPQGEPANSQVTPDLITGLIATAGLDQPKLSAMGSKLQQLSGNKVVSGTGDSGVDQLLRSMGYTVS
jgi:hypothetical protein